MRSFTKPHFRLFLAGSLALVGCLITSVAVFGSNNQAERELAIAKDRWAARSFSRYRMVIKYGTSPGQCQQDVEIQDEKVSTVFQNTCNPARFPGEKSAVAIADLFNQIERLQSTRKCGPNGCLCDGVIGTDAVYDTQLGYPRTLEVKLKPLNPAELWLNPNYWNWKFKNGGLCTLVGFMGEKVTVVSLKPLPARQ